MENHIAYRGQIEYDGYKACVWEFNPGRFTAGIKKETISVNVQGTSLNEVYEMFKTAIDEFRQTVIRNGPEVVYGRYMGGACEVYLTLEEYQERNNNTHQIWKLSPNGQHYWIPGTLYGNSAGDICTTTATQATLHSQEDRYFLRYK